MNRSELAKYTARSRIVKAMAHPTRLYILDLLEKEEMCVQDMTKLIGADISTVSKHLSIMKNVGIIEDEKRGTCVYYRLKCTCIMRFFGCIEEVLKMNAKEGLSIVG